MEAKVGPLAARKAAMSHGHTRVPQYVAQARVQPFEQDDDAPEQQRCQEHNHDSQSDRHGVNLAHANVTRGDGISRGGKDLLVEDPPPVCPYNALQHLTHGPDWRNW